MKERYTVTIHYMKGGKLVKEVFENVSAYSFPTEAFFYMHVAGDFTESTRSSGKYVATQLWFATKDIVKMDAVGGKIAQTERELIELKRAVKGK